MIMIISNVIHVAILVIEMSHKTGLKLKVLLKIICEIEQ